VTEFNEAGAPVAPGDLERLAEKVAGRAGKGGWLVLTGSLPPGCPKDFYLRLIRAAPGLNVALDAEGEALSRAIPGCPFLVKPNRRELEALAGRALGTLSEVRLAAMALIDRGVEMAVVSLGAEGALMAARGGCLYAPAARVEVRSTVGAGDAMVAGLVVSSAARTSMWRSARRSRRRAPRWAPPARRRRRWNAFSIFMKQ